MPACVEISEQTLSARTLRYESLDLINQPIWIFDIDHRLVYWANAAAIAVWGAKSLAELCARNMGCDMSESVARRLVQYQSDFMTGDVVFNEQWTLYPGGAPVCLYVRFSGHRLDDNRMAMLCHAGPIRTEAPESLRSVEALLHTPVMISLYDSNGVALYRNPAARASARVHEQRLEDRIVDPQDYLCLMNSLKAEHPNTFTLSVRTSEGDRWHELSARNCLDAVTGEAAILISEVDVSALKRTEAKANFLAMHDGLTGLPNRSHVIQRFTGAVQEVHSQGREAALIFIDLDHFKDVNDTLGHAAGDDLLIHVAARLRKATRSSDLVARLGGDEFLILLSSRDILGEVDRVRERVLNSVSQPVILRGTEVLITPTMGVSLYPRDGTDFETLLRKADLAMYSGKERGRSEIAYYDEDMGTAVSVRTALESDLRHALERGEFEVHYQPLVCTQTCQIKGAEALVRWRHPQRGLMMPDAFIPLCESTGMILKLGQQVFEMATRQQVAWIAQGHHLKVHVNLSARQFWDPALVAQLRETLLASHCSPANMGIEITESMLLGGDDRSASVLQAIAALGMSIALDDFGTGYSNLAYLQRYPIDTLKIDKTFIQSRDEEKPLAELIASLGRALGMSVVAEGVETQAQLDWVAGRGIEYFQGYLCAGPLQPDAFRSLLERAS
ncbi:MAG: hypothetical protein RL211_1963 [Pseudomonadota bacterium]